MPVRFRIYYGDGTTYSGDPFYAPQLDVQVIAQEKEDGKVRLLFSKDAYYWKEGRWFRCDESGMWDYLFMFQGPKALLFSRTRARDEEFWSILDRAKVEGVE